jgi:hypothetical protein
MLNALRPKALLVIAILPIGFARERPSGLPLSSRNFVLGTPSICRPHDLHDQCRI